MSPNDSDDLSQIIKIEGQVFVVLQSPDNAEHLPNYLELGRFSTREQAEQFLQERVDAD